MRQEKIKLLEYLKFDLLPRLRDKRDIDYVKKQIEKLMKEIENAKNILIDNLGNKAKPTDADTNNNRINAITKSIELNKEYSNIATTTFSAVIGGLKDLNRQSKAICIKALNSGSRKSTEESAISGDIFANVEII